MRTAEALQLPRLPMSFLPTSARPEIDGSEELCGTVARTSCVAAGVRAAAASDATAPTTSNSREREALGSSAVS